MASHVRSGARRLAPGPLGATGLPPPRAAWRRAPCRSCFRHALPRFDPCRSALWHGAPRWDPCRNCFRHGLPRFNSCWGSCRCRPPHPDPCRNCFRHGLPHSNSCWESCRCRPPRWDPCRSVFRHGSAPILSTPELLVAWPSALQPVLGIMPVRAARSDLCRSGLWHGIRHLGPCHSAFRHGFASPRSPPYPSEPMPRPASAWVLPPHLFRFRAKARMCTAPPHRDLSPGCFRYARLMPQIIRAWISAT